MPGTICLKKDGNNLIGISIGGGAQYCPCLYIVQVEQFYRKFKQIVLFGLFVCLFLIPSVEARSRFSNLFFCLHELHPRVIKNLLWQTRRTLVPFSVVVSGCLAGLWQHPRRSGGDSGGRRRDHRREWEAGQGEDKSGGGEDDTSRPGTLGATVNNSTVTVHSCF